MPLTSSAVTSAEMSPLTIAHIFARCSLKSPLPSFATSEGFVVTPSMSPSSLHSRISSRFAVSIKNFIIAVRLFDRIFQHADAVYLHLADISALQLSDSRGRTGRDHIAGQQRHH